MLPVAKGDIVDGRVHVLVLHRLALALTLAREPPGVEGVCVRVDMLVVVEGGGRGDHERAAGNERPVAEHNVLLRLAHEGD